MSTQFISYVFAIILVLFSIIIARNTTLLRETNDPESLYSFSRFQLYLWTTTIAPIFLLHWATTQKMSINNQTLILLGISLATTVSSIVISENPTVKKPVGSNTNPNEVRVTKKNIHKDFSGDLAENIVKRVDREGNEANQVKSEGLIKDVLKDDKGQFSIPRFQNLVFTLIFIFIYITFFFKSGMRELLEFVDDNVYVLMGISTGGYLIGKSLDN